MIVSENVVESIDARTAEVYMRDDDIICVCVKDDVDIDIEDSKETFEAVKKLANGEKKPVLVFTGSGGTITNDVRRFSASKAAGEPTLAEAVIANSLAHKLVVNFLIKFANMGRPMRIFTSESEAVHWLNL
ncbi:MAG: hypothetical protein JKX73_04335, partial [Flavobacteriales bacterium]|nr:hypothetical protein [Flavobacteriales bacterium]